MSRTVVDLDDDLMKRARKLTGLKKKGGIGSAGMERWSYPDGDLHVAPLSWDGGKRLRS